MTVDSAATIRLLAANAPAARLHVVPSLHPPRSQRAVHFIDIENLCGSSTVSLLAGRLAMLAYHRAVGIAVGDHVIIGASHRNMVSGGLSWRGSRILQPRSGPDGADHAIREAIRSEDFPSRFATAFLASGDGGFASDLAWLGAHGVTTTAVATKHSMSPALALAAHHTAYLTDIH